MDRIAVDLELVGAVLELVLLSHDRPRQLAGLANRDETRTDAVGDRGPEDEPAGFDPDDSVDGDAGEPVDHGADGFGERLRITQQRRDVTEDHPLGRVVRDFSNVRAKCAVVSCHVRRLSLVSDASSSAVAADG